ncbi:MAG TPA: hypothetical protein VKE69_02000, partial [Planctomycetota bacterium]|nr:hypothetical protein [Planctomycetota bacterium]
MRAGVALAAAVLATAADEGPLRNQTWVPLAPDAAIRRLALADEALASGNAATAFASLRALVLEARDPSGAPQWLPVDGKADGRVFADPSRILRDRVAALSGPARDAYLADAEIAAHAEAGSATTLAGALALAA